MTPLWCVLGLVFQIFLEFLEYYDYQLVYDYLWPLCGHTSSPFLLVFMSVIRT